MKGKKKNKRGVTTELTTEKFCPEDKEK